MQKKEIEVLVADERHEKYVDTILDTIARAAAVRGTGIAKRTHEYLANKMKEAKAVIALCGNKFAGFRLLIAFKCMESSEIGTNSGHGLQWIEGLYRQPLGLLFR